MFLKYKLDLISRGFKTYLSGNRYSDYEILPDEIIELIMKMVNKPNLNIIINISIFKCNINWDRQWFNSRTCMYCNTPYCKHTNNKPCPMKYLDPKYPTYIKDKNKRMKLIKKIKSKKVKRWISGHNIIISKDNEIINPNVNLFVNYDNPYSYPYNLKCICGSFNKIYSNDCGHDCGYRNSENNIRYDQKHNNYMKELINNEKVIDNMFKLIEN
tara:strand:- start:174 stop:815 length:642 start_codon:yes stop_codon:yes gene_type:complete